MKNSVFGKKMIEICVNLWETDKIKQITKIKRLRKTHINPYPK